MHDNHNDSVTRNGKRYHYDPDYDCYRTYHEETILSRWAWLIVGIVLAIVCWRLDT